MAFTGYVVYRFRQTCHVSCGTYIFPVWRTTIRKWQSAMFIRAFRTIFIGPNALVKHSGGVFSAKLNSARKTSNDEHLKSGYSVDATEARRRSRVSWHLSLRERYTTVEAGSEQQKPQTSSYAYIRPRLSLQGNSVV